MKKLIILCTLISIISIQVYGMKRAKHNLHQQRYLKDCEKFSCEFELISVRDNTDGITYVFQCSKCHKQITQSFRAPTSSS